MLSIEAVLVFNAGGGGGIGAHLGCVGGRNKSTTRLCWYSMLGIEAVLVFNAQEV